MRFDILSLFPEYFSGPFDVSILKRARERGLLEIGLTDIRDFAVDGKADDRCYGGGPGMVLKPEPIAAAIRHVKREGSWVIYLTPQGSKLDAAKCASLAQLEHIVLLCGHYEGVDERVIEHYVDEELSIGDFVLTNGCIAAIALLDGVIRFCDGVLGHEDAAALDSFQEGVFDAPHYTRPREFEGSTVPPVLLSGNHQAIEAWRREKSLEKTRRVRPELARPQR